MKMTKLLNKLATTIDGADLSFKIHYWGAMSEHFDNPIHRHSFFEVCYVLDGEGTYKEMDQSYPLSSGALFCSRPGQWHQIKSQSGLALFFVAFEINESCSKQEKVIQYLQLRSCESIYIPMSDETMTLQVWRMLFNLCIREELFSKEMIHSLAHTLFMSFHYTFVPRRGSQFAIENQLNSSYLMRVKLFVEDNLASPLSLKLISSYLYISERHITRLFSEEVGQTFSHYVQERRIQRAMEYLLDTDWSVSRIAQETGFNSIHYFTRVFTSKTGVSPGIFRKTQLSEVPFSKKMSL
jgi:AraC family L-rhamnose operon transcriptional activator RhaR